jgi:hypothetical protein
MMELIKDHSGLYQWDPKKNMGRTKIVTFEIDTRDSHPISQQKFTYPKIIHDKIKKDVEDMLELDCEWSSPSFLGEWDQHSTFVSNVRSLNAVTRKIGYPTTRI